MGSLLLDVGGGDDLGGQVKPFAEVVETLGGQSVVVVLPGELSLDIATGGQGLGGLDDEEVLGVDVGVLGKVVVLLGDEYTLAEEVLENKLPSTAVPPENWFAAPAACFLPRGSSCGRPWESTSWRLRVLGSMLER